MNDRFIAILGAPVWIVLWQADEGGSGIPWWLWLIIILLLLLLLFIGLVRLQRPGPPLPEPESEPEPEADAPSAAPTEEQPAEEEPAAEDAPAEEAVVEKAATEEAAEKASAEEAATEEAAVVEVPTKEPSEPDDLRKIEGIGPKISNLLNESGITTYDTLAQADVDQLRKILDDAGIRIADPTTWPEQAKVAASGDWEKLSEIQENLKGGRRS